MKIEIKDFTVSQAKDLIKILTDAVEEAEKGNDNEKCGEISYDAVMKSLYQEIDPKDYANWQNCTNKSQLDRMKAFNKLQNIAKYLNGKNWRTDFSKHNYYTILKINNCLYIPHMEILADELNVVFKNKELCERAIEIMGTEELGKLFNSNW